MNEIKKGTFKDDGATPDSRKNKYKYKHIRNGNNNENTSAFTHRKSSDPRRGSEV